MKKYIKNLISLLCVFALVCSTFIAATAEETATDYTEDYKTIIDRWEETIIGDGNPDMTDKVISEKVESITSDAKAYWDSMSRPTEEEAAAGMTLAQKWLSNTERWSPEGEYNGVYPIEHKGYIWADESANPAALVARTRFAAVQTSLERLRTMAIAYRISADSTIKGNAILKNDIYAALEFICTYWYCPNAVQFGNWWYWQIGVPMALRDVLVLLYDDIVAEKADLLNLCLTAIDTFPPLPGHTMDGANLADRSAIQIVYGALWQREDIIQNGSNGIASVLTYVTKASGFYEADGSFIQHIYYAYTGSYGSSVMRSIAPALVSINGTPFDISDEKKENLANIIFDVYEPVFYNGTVMQMTYGRSITSNHGSIGGYISGKTIINAIAMLGDILGEEYSKRIKSFSKYHIQCLISEEALALYDYYANTDLGVYLFAKAILEDENIVARDSYNMSNIFFNMDRVVQHNNKYSLGLSMSSTRISSFEGGNGNNRKGWYTGSGMLYVYNNDYSKFTDHIWYTIDSYRLPGTTVLRGVPNLPYTDEGIALGQSAWAGGTSIGNYSTAGMQLQPYKQTLNAKKSWFMFDNEVVALGTDITSTDGSTIESTVENIKILDDNSNEFVIDGTIQENTLVTDGVATATTINKWAYLSGNNAKSSMGYYFPESANLNIIREARTGKKRDVDTSTSVEADYVEYTKNYLTMYYDHGQYGNGDNSYSYVLLPSATQAETKTYSENADIEILANNENVQAVTDKKLGITGANFWNNKAATVQKDGKDYITSNGQSSVMVEETDSEITIAVSDPTQLNTEKFCIEVNASAASVLQSHEDITVLQYSPSVIIEVDPTSDKAAFQGETKTIVLEKGENPDTTEIAPALGDDVELTIIEDVETVIKLDFAGTRPVSFTISGAPDGTTVDKFGVVYIPETLKNGKYTFNVTATNEFGSDSVTFNVTRKVYAVTPVKSVVYYNFDEAEGTYVSTYSNIGTIAAANDLNANITDSTEWVDGVVGTALEFDSLDDGLSMVKVADEDQDAIGLNVTKGIFGGQTEFDFWVKFYDNPKDREQMIFAKNHSSANIPYGVKVNTDGQIGYCWGASWTYSNSLDWNTDEWYHISIIRNSSNVVTIQRDSIDVGAVGTVGSAIYVKTGICINDGKFFNSNNYFNGAIDELTIGGKGSGDSIRQVGKVTFVADGNTISPQYVKLNNTATEPTAPTKENAIFAGWYTDSKCTNKYDFTTPVTTDFALYAGWVDFGRTETKTPTKSFIYYNFNEGSGSAIGTQSTHNYISSKYSAYDFGATISDSTEWVKGFVGAGLNFNSINDTLKMNSSTTNAYDYAIRMSPRLVGTTEYDFWVKFNENPVTTGREQIIILRSNYNKLIYWGVKVNASGQIVLITQGKENSSSTLNWNTNEWYHITITQDKNNLVTFKRDGLSVGTSEGTEPASSKVGIYINNTADTNAKNLITSSNYFNGILDELCLGNAGVGESVRVRSKVNFNTNGADYIEPQYPFYDETATEIVPIKDGYNFAGWYTDAEFTTKYDFTQLVTSDITLYAKWEKQSVIGDANGDGEIATDDMILLRQYLLGTINTEIADITVFDVYADGVINLKDLIRYKKYFAGVVNKLG